MPDVACSHSVALLGLAGHWWWRQAPRRRLMLLGCGLIFFSYWLTYSARASLPYDGQEHSVSQWNRYHLLPYLGLVFLPAEACRAGGNSLSAGSERLTDSRPSGRFVAAHCHPGGVAVSGELDRTSADRL